MRAMRLAFVFLIACAHAPAVLAPGDHMAGETAYHVIGSGPPCLMVPGGPGLDWKYLRSPALEQQLTVIYVEPLGTAGSAQLPPGELYSLSRFAAQLETLRQVLHLGRACVIGHSYGGMIAATWAIEHPDSVGELVLYSSPSREGKEFGEAMVAALEHWKDRPWFAGAKAAMLGDDALTDAAATEQWKQAVPFLFAEWDEAKYGASVYVPTYAAVYQQPDKQPVDLRPRLAKIRAATLILVGATDFCCGERWGQELSAGIAGATVERFEHSGHMSHLEEPAHFADVIARFTRGHRGT
jgi:proline iminopeptidase